MVLRTSYLLATAKRIPLIKFRKGNPIVTSTGSSVGSHPSSVSSAPQGVSSGGSASKAAYSTEAIEDWQLPARFKRKPIDPTEMEYINRGGPA